MRHASHLGTALAVAGASLAPEKAGPAASAATPFAAPAFWEYSAP